MKKLLLILVFALVLCACQPALATPFALPPSKTPSLPGPTLTNTATPAHTATPTSLPETATPTRPLAPTSVVIVKDGRGSLYQILFTIPVGKDGVNYWGGGLQEITGPNAFAILPDGNLVISDYNTKRLLFYTPTGGFCRRAIDLAALGISYAYDVKAGRSALFLLEAYDKYKVHRISLDGKLEASYYVPADFRMETGLSGITIGSQDEVLLEVEGSLLYQFVNSQGEAVIPMQTGYPYNGRQYRVNADAGLSAARRMMAGDIKIETKLSGNLGGLRLLGVLPNGDFLVAREDVIATDVDQTVHYLNAQGVQLGVARFPLTERYYSIEKDFAIVSDGNVIALLPHPDSMKVIRLIFYKHLEPLIPGAVEPLITFSGNNP